MAPHKSESPDLATVQGLQENQPSTASLPAPVGVSNVAVDDAHLAHLAEKINLATAAAEHHARWAVDHALVAGQALVEAKSQLAHGEWETWLGANCSIASRTARAYMKLAMTVPQLPAEERQRVADLSLREAIKAIAADPARAEAESNGQSGHKTECTAESNGEFPHKETERTEASGRKARGRKPAAKPAPQPDESRFDPESACLKVVHAIRSVAATWPADADINLLVSKLRKEADRLEKRRTKSFVSILADRLEKQRKVQL